MQIFNLGEIINSLWIICFVLIFVYGSQNLTKNINKWETFIWIRPMLAVTFGFFTIRISVTLSDRSKVTQNKINFVKNCISGVWTHNLLIITLMLYQLNSAAIVKQKISEANFVSCTTSHFGLLSLLESIEHDFIKTLMIHTDNQTVT